MNETIETILSRRTIHDFTSEPIDQDILETALRCGLRAPNHKLTNPWRFVRANSKQRIALCDIAVEVKNQKRPVTPEQESAIRKKVSCAPELIVVAQTLSDDAFRQREDYAACACAIQNISLALWSNGVGSKWASGAVTYSPKTYALFDIDRSTHEIIAFLWIGKPVVVPDPPRDDLSAVYREME